MITSASPASDDNYLKHSTDDLTYPVHGTQFRLQGDSPAMQQVRERIFRLANSNAPVAIFGESGCGKELAARDIHAHSLRRDMPFVAVNCGAIPDALMEAEFFGCRKGAFTGATQDRDGFFQAAQGGTLLLDEVADLPLAMQVKLLRAIQERRIRMLGSTREDVVDVRIISATHQNLAREVQQGRFRQDLFYRLNVIELQLPPLRARREDIAPLAAAILQRQSAVSGAAVLSPSALAGLCAYDFPGNVRELENMLERALAFVCGGVIELADLDFEGGTPEVVMFNPAVVKAAPASHQPDDALPVSLPAHLQSIERDLIFRALHQSRFNRTRAAGLLGISLRQLRYRMQRLAIHDLD